jgi:hypothetical protein
MSSWRCDKCHIEWPFIGQFSGHCSVCDHPVWPSSEGIPIGVDEAQRLKGEARADRKTAKAKQDRVAEFERRYADREVTAAMQDFEAEWAALNAPPSKEAA